MFKLITIPAALFLVGCFAQTEAEPAPACGWQDNPETNTETCPAPFAFSSTKRFELLDEGASACWFYDSICVTPGALLDECRRTHVTCQPVGEARVGGP
jgi:hypothetical protein